MSSSWKSHGRCTAQPESFVTARSLTIAHCWRRYLLKQKPQTEVHVGIERKNQSDFQDQISGVRDLCCSLVARFVHRRYRTGRRTDGGGHRIYEANEVLQRAPHVLCLSSESNFSRIRERSPRFSETIRIREDTVQSPRAPSTVPHTHKRTRIGAPITLCFDRYSLAAMHRLARSRGPGVTCYE